MKSFSLLLLLIALCTGGTSTVQAQMRKKMDLDDLSVKGEMHSDDRLSILARQKNDLKDYVRYRKDFRPELYQELPKERPIKTKASN
jgi:hypothetical protein